MKKEQLQLAFMSFPPPEEMNKLCRKCKKWCKQDLSVTIVECKQFISKASRKKK